MPSDDVELEPDQEELSVDDILPAAETITVADGGVNTIAPYMDYLYRGPELRNLSLYSYSAIVQKIPVPKDKDSIAGNEVSTAARRPCNGTFRFTTEHPQCETHIQRLRSKQLLPIICGPHCPPHPGPYSNDTHWITRANTFAKYMLALFYLWDSVLLAPDVPLRYEYLLAWTLRLTQSSNLIDRATLFWMQNVSCGLTVDFKTLKMISDHRGRSTINWTAAERLVHGTSGKPSPSAERFSD